MVKQKILIFTTSYYPFVGGAEVAIQEIARRLKERFDFYIVTARFNRRLPRREVVPEGTIVRIGFGTLLDKYFLPFACTKLSLVRGDAVLGVDISHASVSAAIFKLLHPRIPFIFNIQFGESEEHLASARWGIIAPMFRFILSQADHVTTISTYLLELARRYGYEGTGEVIHNGVDVEKFKAQSEKRKTATQNSKIIITTSRLVPKNGIDILIGAMVEVIKKIPDAECWVIGDGPERRNYELEIRNYGLKNNVKLLGAVPHEKIPEYLRQADVFVRPSRSEGMGISFVEALAAGVPIIGTSVGGITDIIEDGKTGLFVKVDDSSGLAEKILKLLNDPILASAIVREGQKMTEMRFSWDKIAKQYARVFENIRKNLCVLVATPLYPPEIGGPATYSRILADELPKRGLRADVVKFRDVRHFPKFVRHVVYFIKIFKRGRNADIIFSQDPLSAGFPAAMAALALRKKFLVKIVGDYAWEQGVQRFGVRELLDEFLEKRYGWQVEILRKIERWVANRALRVIVPSLYLKTVVLRWGITEDKITVIPNAFETPETEISREEARSRLLLSGRVLISVGRLVPWKGFVTLIEIISELRRSFPDLRLVIIGDGPERKTLELDVTRYKLQAHVKLLGSIPHDKVLLYLRAGDIFVLNTGYEGMPHAVMEAMAVGVPVVTTRIGGNEGVVEDRVNGLLVGYNKKEELREAIQRILIDDALRRTLTGNAKKKVAEFTKEKMIERTIEVIRQL